MYKGENTLESRAEQSRAEQSRAEQSRADWIDVLKGIGIILVVIGHVNTKGFLVQWLYTFHMPLFFALSGYILYKFGKNIPFQKFLLKRTKSILWPFILFRLLLFIYWIVIESHFRDFDMGPIWFLIILYLAELVAYPIFYNKKSNSFWIVFVCCFVSVLWFALKLVLPASFLSSWFLRFLNGLIWYILGYICGIVEQDIRMISLASKQKIFLTSLLYLLSVAIGYLNPEVSMWSNSYGKNYLLFMLGGIIGSTWLGFVCKWFVTRNTFLQFLGQNTITILAVHEPIKRIVLKIAEMGTQRVRAYRMLSVALSRLQNLGIWCEDGQVCSADGEKIKKEFFEEVKKLAFQMINSFETSLSMFFAKTENIYELAQSETASDFLLLIHHSHLQSDRSKNF